MAKYLVVIEAPGKVGKFKSILPKEYDVVPTAGHVIDLPQKQLGIDLKKDFKATYEVIPGKEDVLKEIQNKAKKADIVYLATDLDREGTAIAWHVANNLPKGTKVKRVVTNSITKQAVLDAIKNAGEIDLPMVESYETRRGLDRIVGFKFSYPVKQATGGISAGRVQSAGLRIIADREKEILGFVPEVYWPIEAELLTPNTEKVLALIKTPKPLDIKTKEEADTIIGTFKKGPVKVSKHEIREEKVNCYPPFITSTIQQTASSFLGFNSDRTMKTCQSLYEKGVITYHRTDSTFIIQDFISATRDYIKANFKPEYLPSSANSFAKKSAHAQEAHEAIRPTDIKMKTYVGGSSDEAKLYEMIWKRTVSCQMSPAKYERVTAEFTAGKYVLGANGSKELFDGFRKVWTYGTVSEGELPKMKVGDLMKVLSITTEKKETQPPNRYSEGSFVKELEKRGIGRPATYAAIIKTLRARKYIEEKGKTLKATELGIKVSDYLIKTGACFIDLNFTSDMENKLDMIADQKRQKVEVLTEFWTRLKADLDKAKTTKAEVQKTEFDCTECKKGKLVKKFSKFGAFFACEHYPECKATYKVGEDGKPLPKVEKEKPKESKFPCPKCKKKLVIRVSKKTGKEFLGCSGWPKCDSGIFDLEGNKIEFKKKPFKKWGKKSQSEDDDE